MDTEKLIERVVGELSEHVVIGTTHSETSPSGAETAFFDEPLLDPRPASRILRDAFAEVRRVALVEMDQAIVKHMGDLPADRRDLAAYGAREAWLGRRALLPPTAEGVVQRKCPQCGRSTCEGTHMVRTPTAAQREEE